MTISSLSGWNRFNVLDLKIAKLALHLDSSAKILCNNTGSSASLEVRLVTENFGYSSEVGSNKFEPN